MCLQPYLDCWVNYGYRINLGSSDPHSDFSFLPLLLCALLFLQRFMLHQKVAVRLKRKWLGNLRPNWLTAVDLQKCPRSKRLSALALVEVRRKDAQCIYGLKPKPIQIVKPQKFDGFIAVIQKNLQSGKWAFMLHLLRAFPSRWPSCLSALCNCLDSRRWHFGKCCFFYAWGLKGNRPITHLPRRMP